MRRSNMPRLPRAATCRTNYRAGAHDAHDRWRSWRWWAWRGIENGSRKQSQTRPIKLEIVVISPYAISNSSVGSEIYRPVRYQYFHELEDKLLSFQERRQHQYENVLQLTCKHMKRYAAVSRPGFIIRLIDADNTPVGLRSRLWNFASIFNWH